MALPADFSKIYGSTATGGLTPISDVDYAKGWEFVGSNPPTKNDFSYLQNFSDLKSQWLYANKLQRTDPFGDIKSDGTVSQALSNLGLGDLANALIKTNNLSDLPDKAVSRTNLGVPAGVNKQMCTAWASWSNNGTVCTIKDSFGVSSVTRTAQGACQVNFSASMANTNYDAVYSPGAGANIIEGGSVKTKTVSTCGTQSWGGNGQGLNVALNAADFPDNNIQIFGGK